MILQLYDGLSSVDSEARGRRRLELMAISMAASGPVIIAVMSIMLRDPIALRARPRSKPMRERVQ